MGVTPCPPPRWASVCHRFLHSQVKVCLVLFYWPNSGKNSVFVKSKCGEKAIILNQIPPLGKAIAEHRRRCSPSTNIAQISRNDYTILLMTGDKDGKQSQTYQTGIVLLKSISWTKPFTATWTHWDNAEAQGSSVLLMRCQCPSERLCHRGTDAQNGVDGNVLQEACTAQRRRSQNSLFYQYSLLNKKWIFSDYLPLLQKTFLDVFQG